MVSSSGIQSGIMRQTVLNRLRTNTDPIRASRPYVTQIIHPHNRYSRLLWARRHLRWTRASGQGSCLHMSPISI